MAHLIDPTQTGKYPVVLGDGLLGKTANDIFTGIRCTYQPSPPIIRLVLRLMSPSDTAQITTSRRKSLTMA